MRAGAKRSHSPHSQRSPKSCVDSSEAVPRFLVVPPPSPHKEHLMGIRLRTPAMAGGAVALTTAAVAVLLTTAPTASAASTTFTAVADTYVQASTASTNYGTS